MLYGRDCTDRAIVSVHEASIELHFADNVWNPSIADRVDLLVLLNSPETTFKHIVPIHSLEQPMHPLIDSAWGNEIA
jgi:hypothetical protein